MMEIFKWLQESEGVFWIILKIAIVIAAGAVINFLVRSLVTSYFKRESHHINVDPTAFSFVKNAFTFIMFIITLFIVIYMIPAFKHIATTLFAGAGVVAAIVGFASQAAFSNIINGIFLVIFKPFRIGDFIEIRKLDEYTGRVEDITLRHTVIKNGENKRIIVPNSVISSEIIVNRSLVDEKVVRFLDIQVSYTTDLDHAIAVIRDECAKHPLFMDPRTQLQIENNEEKVEVRVVRFGDFGILLRANVCGETSPESSILVSDLYLSLKKRFEKEGIEIPYPYTNVVLKTKHPKMSDPKTQVSLFRQASESYKGGIKSGLPPGSLVYVGEEKQTQLSIAATQYKEDKIIELKANTIEELLPQLQKGFNTWINIDGVHDSKLINDVGRAFGLENLSLEDIMNTNGRPKFEEFENYIYIILKDLYCSDEDYFGIEQISMIIKDNLLITFQEEPGDVFDGVRNRLRAGTTKIRVRGIDYLAYSLMDAIIDNYFVVGETYDHFLDDLEDLLYATTHRRQLTKIKEAKKHFGILKRTVHPMKEMVYNMYRTEHKLFAKKTHIYIRDLFDHITSIQDTLDQSRDKVYGLMSIYQSGTNNIMNNIVKTLTIVSTVFMALSLIAGIYGMNFNPEKSPYNMPELNWMYGYPAALGLMFVVSIILLLYFRFKKWL